MNQNKTEPLPYNHKGIAIALHDLLMASSIPMSRANDYQMAREWLGDIVGGKLIVEVEKPPLAEVIGEGK